MTRRDTDTAALEGPSPTNADHTAPLSYSSGIAAHSEALGRGMMCTEAMLGSGGGGLRKVSTRTRNPKGCDSLKFRYHFRWVTPPQCQKLKGVTYQPPQGCVFPELDPALILRTLGNRTLWIVGDSISRQIFDMWALCTLARFMKSHERGNQDGRGIEKLLKDRMPFRSFDELRAKANGEDLLPCKGNCVTFSVPAGPHKHVAKMCHVWAQREILAPGSARCFREMRSQDVVLVNIGAWFPSAALSSEYKAAVQNFTQFVANSKPGNRPLVIWRESTQENFPVEGGQFVNYSKIPDSKRAKKCQSTGGDNNWRNEIVKPLAEAAGIPMLPIFQLTDGKNKWAHTLQAGTWKQGKLDCNHFCMYSNSIFDVWLRFFQNFAADLLHR